MSEKHGPTIQNLYPELPPEEQKEARKRLDAYLKLIQRIYERKQGRVDGDTLSEDCEE